MYKVCQEINLNPPAEGNEGFYSVRSVRGIKRLSLFFIQGSTVLDWNSTMNMYRIHPSKSTSHQQLGMLIYSKFVNSPRAAFKLTNQPSLSSAKMVLRAI